MTSTAEVGNLRVRLGIDSAEFSNGIRGVQEQLKGFGENIKRFAEATAAVEIFSRAVEALHQVADIGKLAETIGVTAEQLQVFNRMAVDAHTTTEEMAKGLESVAEQSTNAKSELSKLFDANGITTKGKSINEIMMTFMDLIKNAKTPAEQLAIAVDVLGKKVGRQLIDALKEGAGGWHDAMAAMKADGSDLSEAQVKEAMKIEKAYNDMLARLTAEWQKFSLLIAGIIDSAINPDMGSSKNGFRSGYGLGAANGTKFGSGGQPLPLTPGADGNGDLPGNLNLDAGGTLSKPTTNPFNGDPVDKLKKTKKALEDNGKAAKTDQDIFNDLWDSMSQGMDVVLPEAEDLTTAYLGLADVLSSDLGDALAGLLSGTMSLKDAFTQLTQSIARDLEQLAAQLLKSSIMKLLEYLPGLLAGGGGAGFSLGGMTFGGLYADGGTLGAGQWGIAGEAGPEIVHGPATITPMSKMGGGGVNVNVNNYANANVQTSRQSDGSLQIDIIEKHLASRVSRGGSILSQSLEKGYGLKRSGR